MIDLITALGLVLVIEGIIYALTPAGMKRGIAEMLKMSDHSLRLGGLIVLTIGFIIVWLVRH